MNRAAKFLVSSLFLLFVLVTVDGKWSDYRRIVTGKSLEDLLKSLEPRNLLKSYKVLSGYRSESNGSSAANYTCERDILIFEQALFKRETWALKMLDASSKIPAGLMEGNIIDLGMYDECMAVQGRSLTIDIRGRHCMYSIAATHSNVSLPLNPTLSICVPASCTDSDVVELINGTINAINKLKDIGIKVVSATCVTVDPVVWDNAFIICLTILLVFVGFLVICSICEAVNARLDAGEYRHPALRSLSQFSFQRSASAVFNREITEGALPAIHGIRFLSIAWIALGHEYYFHIFGANVNLLNIVDWVQSWKSLYIFVAPFAVDTFFTLSGFLITYMFMKEMSRRRKFNLLTYYLHRYIRLTPAVIAVIVFSIVFVPKLGSGAKWDMLIELFFVEKCREKWWTNILYVQNFVDQDNLCLGHLWYLAVDMQLFWISPIILYPLYKAPKIGLGILGVLFAVSIAVPASIVGINKYPAVSFTHYANVTLVMDIFKNVYEMPYNRAGPWLLGIYFGYQVANKNLRLSKLNVYFGWIGAISSFVFCILGTRSFTDPSYVYNPIWETFFTAVCRQIWAFGVCWLIYASASGCGGPVSSFLSWKIFLPLSRLSYCFYLVHLIIQTMQISALRVPRYFSDFYVWNYYLSDFIISIVVAFFFSLLFESPVMILEKLLFKEIQQLSYQYKRQRNDSENFAEECTTDTHANGHASNIE